MNENRLADYLEHMQQAALDACAFVEGMGHDEFAVTGVRSKPSS